MVKIFNENMKSRQLATAIGLIMFNSDGICEVENDEYAQELIKLDGFETFEGELSKPLTTEEKLDSDENNAISESEDVDENGDSGVLEDLSGKSVAQLRKIAKDKGIDLGNVVKRDEIIEAITNAMNQ